MGGHLRGRRVLFGNIPVVKENFELVVLGIVGVSLLPLAFEIGASAPAGLGPASGQHSAARLAPASLRRRAADDRRGRHGQRAHFPDRWIRIRRRGDRIVDDQRDVVPAWVVSCPFRIT